VVLIGTLIALVPNMKPQRVAVREKERAAVEKQGLVVSG
jgi:hypothetical protein